LLIQETNGAHAQIGYVFVTWRTMSAIYSLVHCG